MDLKAGALLAVTMQNDDQATPRRWLRRCAGRAMQEAVLDKSYHSNALLQQLDQQQIRSYVPEPNRGRRRWAGKAREQQLVYANRRRVNRVKRKRFT